MQFEGALQLGEWEKQLHNSQNVLVRQSVIQQQIVQGKAMSHGAAIEEATESKEVCHPGHRGLARHLQQSH